MSLISPNFNLDLSCNSKKEHELNSDAPLNSASIEAAVKLIRNIAPDTRAETRFIDDADGHILAHPIICLSDMPGYDRSWKNGFAIFAADTRNADPAHPARLTVSGSVSVGESKTSQISKGCCMVISTGCCLPTGSDAVVMSEDVVIRDSIIELTSPVFPGENIIRRDEDAKAGEVLYPSGWVLRPQDIAVLAGFGICTVQVWSMPVIGIISSGPELVPAEARPSKGEVRETNSYLISALCRRVGAIPRRYGIAWDGSGDLSKILTSAVSECDAIIISGGSNRDDRDRTAEIISKQGHTLLSGLTVSPRKKMIIGEIRGKPVIGLPGHPASVFLLLILVVTNLIQAMKGASGYTLLKEQVKAGVDIRAHPEREYHIPVRIIDGKAFPLSRKAGMISLLSQCDGIVHIPMGDNIVKTGDIIDVMDLTLLRSPSMVH